MHVKLATRLPEPALWPDLPDNLAQYTSDLLLRFAMPPGCTALDLCSRHLP
jgi:hypothetical protein